VEINTTFGKLLYTLNIDEGKSCLTAWVAKQCFPTTGPQIASSLQLHLQLCNNPDNIVS